jgi:hypothetical protein
MLSSTDWNLFSFSKSTRNSQICRLYSFSWLCDWLFKKFFSYEATKLNHISWRLSLANTTLVFVMYPSNSSSWPKIYDIKRSFTSCLNITCIATSCFLCYTKMSIIFYGLTRERPSFNISLTYLLSSLDWDTSTSKVLSNFLKFSAVLSKLLGISMSGTSIDSSLISKIWYWIHTNDTVKFSL